MKCDQARDMLLDRLDGNDTLPPNPDLELHLDECRDCQIWYEQQKLAAEALEKLDSYPVPDNFTAKVLDQLPEQTRWHRRPSPLRHGNVSTSLGQAWRDFVASLSRPAGRRRVVPALAMAAAVFVVAIFVFAIVQGSRVPVTPGAVTGSPAGMIVIGAFVLVVLVVLGVLFLRRK